MNEVNQEEKGRSGASILGIASFVVLGTACATGAALILGSVVTLPIAVVAFITPEVLIAAAAFSFIGALLLFIFSKPTPTSEDNSNSNPTQQSSSLVNPNQTPTSSPRQNKHPNPQYNVTHNNTNHISRVAADSDLSVILSNSEIPQNSKKLEISKELKELSSFNGIETLDNRNVINLISDTFKNFYGQSLLHSDFKYFVDCMNELLSILPLSGKPQKFKYFSSASASALQKLGEGDKAIITNAINKYLRDLTSQSMQYKKENKQFTMCKCLKMSHDCCKLAANENYIAFHAFVNSLTNDNNLMGEIQKNDKQDFNRTGKKFFKKISDTKNLLKCFASTGKKDSNQLCNLLTSYANGDRMKKLNADDEYVKNLKILLAIMKAEDADVIKNLFDIDNEVFANNLFSIIVDLKKISITFTPGRLAVSSILNLISPTTDFQANKLAKLATKVTSVARDRILNKNIDITIEGNSIVDVLEAICDMHTNAGNITNESQYCENKAYYELISAYHDNGNIECSSDFFVNDKSVDSIHENSIIVTDSIINKNQKTMKIVVGKNCSREKRNLLISQILYANPSLNLVRPGDVTHANFLEYDKNLHAHYTTPYDPNSNNFLGESE